MTNEFYQIPINFETILERKEIKRINLKNSISQYIRLIISTHFGEFESDKDFGCLIWEDEFNLNSNHMAYKESLKLFLKDLIGKYENRLKNINVDIDFLQVIKENSENRKVIRTRVDINILASIALTNAGFNLLHSFYISPYSEDK